jgi:hypothetical protein
MIEVGGMDAELSSDLQKASDIMRRFALATYTPQFRIELKRLAVRIDEADKRIRNALAPGWICECGIFMHDLREKLTHCRSCDKPRNPKKK